MAKRRISTPAQRSWKKLSAEKQFSVLEEIIETRGDELRLAHKNVLTITPGLKRARASARDKQLLRRPQLAVIFTVKKKRGKNELKPGEAIPSEILTYQTVDRKRCLCAIPTDVECLATRTPITPDVRRIDVDNPDGGWREGVIACVVKLPPKKVPPEQGDDEIRPFFALSCRHVFKDVGEVVALDGRRIGVVTNKRGDLVVQAGFSFDAALARVTDTLPAGDALGGLCMKTRARNMGDILANVNYWVHTNRKPLRAQFRDRHYDPVYYRGIGEVKHSVLIQSRMLNEPTVCGDSGSPVTTLKSGGRLLGMHIAGNGDRGGDSALMIPAWELLKTDNYKNVTPKNDRLRLWSKI